MSHRAFLLRSMTLGMALLCACVMRKGGPDFKRFSREHQLGVKPAVHNAGGLEWHILSGTATETYFVYGSESFTAHINVRLSNNTSQPVIVDMDSTGAFRPGVAHAIAVYFSKVTLEPGGKADLTINIPAGLSKLERPLALNYKGTRMELAY